MKCNFRSGFELNLCSLVRVLEQRQGIRENLCARIVPTTGYSCGKISEALREKMQS